MKAILRKVILVVLIIIASVVLIESLRLLFLKHSVTTYKNYWQQRNQQNVSAQTFYVALGDSAAQGVGASSPENGYVGLIANALTLKSEQQIRVVNLSVSGAKVRDVIDQQLPQLQQLPINDKTIITLEIGANDLKAFDEPAFTEAIKQLLMALPSQTIVAEIPYFGGGIFRNREPHAVRATSIIREAAEEQHLKLALLYSATKANNNLSYFAADGFHPNDKGYQNWFLAFKSALDL